MTEPTRRPLARYAHPCPVCRRESLPGTVEGLYTREGLRACLTRMRERAAKQRTPVPAPPADAPTPPSPHQDQERDP